MSQKRLNIIDTASLSRLLEQPTLKSGNPEPAPGEWVRIVRSYLRMTQVELSRRSKIGQSHLVAIEQGRIDPQIGTLRRLFEALSCGISISPVPIKPLKEVLRGRARSVALKRLKQTMGTMALEKQQPDREMFKQLLEKRTDEILEDKRGRLWVGDNE